jgi:tritrans,polycis-undecaprenyl-diphosphate synthase [geranylgeranyl-diphosphate specific]
MLRPAYKAYELWLWSQIYNGPKPRHVAIIPDGNRRWAANMGLPPLYGHNIGYEKLKEVLEWLWELDIKAVTIYAMSYENCIKRPKEERENLLNLLQKGISELIQDEIIDERKIRIKFFGYLDMVPAEIRKNIADVEQYSRKYNERFLNIALCYGGRQEIIKAVKRIAKDSREGKIKPDEISEKVFRKYLSTSHLEDGLEEPDLVIRTSGELRISNFLLWQIAYSELYFCDAFWPEFRKIDLWRAIRSYQKRERRFGK